MTLLFDVVNVDAWTAYVLHDFETGARWPFHISSYKDEKPADQWKRLCLLASPSIINGTVGWPRNINIAPETLYYRSFRRS